MLCLSRSLALEEGVVVNIPPGTDWRQMRIKVSDDPRCAGCARLSFDAPREIEIVRDELVETNDGPSPRSDVRATDGP